MRASSSSLTRRLILTLTMGFAVIWILAAAATLLLLRAELYATLDSGLGETAQRLLPLALDGFDDGDGDFDTPHKVPLIGDDRDDYIMYQVRDASGRVLLRSDDAPDQGFDVPLEIGFSTIGRIRIYTDASRDGRMYIQVAENLGHRDRSLLESVLTLFLPLAAVLPLTALGIWLVVRQGLRPVSVLRAQLAARGGANLEPLSAEMPTELAPIADAVNGLFARLSAALQAERNFAANSAHELRTPIAGALAQTQRLLAELPEGKTRERGLQIEATLKRLGLLTEKLLQLSRADAGMSQTGRLVDLSEVISVVVEDIKRHQADPGRIDLRWVSHQPPIAAIDPDAFAIALRNIVENALAHGAKDSPVRIEVETPRIRIFNHGPIVSPDDLAGLKQRFIRGKTSATGTGLGLAIADMIMTQTGGQLELFSPAAGQTDGFEADLVLGSSG